MRFTVIGGSGFIGSALTEMLLREGHHVSVIDLRPSRVKGAVSHIADIADAPLDPALLEGTQAVVHLAGRPIFDKWNAGIKRDIMESRVRSVRNAVQAIAKLPSPPESFVCASACGIYGEGGDAWLDESAPKGEGFLADVCEAWEREAAAVEAYGVRRVSIRTGLVLGRNGGLLAEALPLFRLGFGGRLGSGRQWMSWVHIDDIAPIYRHAALTADLRGPVNCASPEPVTNARFTTVLARVLHRPALLPVPRFALRWAFGDFADEILRSQRLDTGKLTASGYVFRHPHLASAIDDALDLTP